MAAMVLDRLEDSVYLEPTQSAHILRVGERKPADKVLTLAGSSSRLWSWLELFVVEWQQMQ
jgi:hypothetical protein